MICKICNSNKPNNEYRYYNGKLLTRTCKTCLNARNHKRNEEERIAELIRQNETLKEIMVEIKHYKDCKDYRRMLIAIEKGARNAGRKRFKKGKENI